MEGLFHYTTADALCDGMRERFAARQRHALLGAFEGADLGSIDIRNRGTGLEFRLAGVLDEIHIGSLK